MLSVIKLSAIVSSVIALMLSVLIPIVILLSVIILSDFMQNVVAPTVSFQFR